MKPLTLALGALGGSPVLLVQERVEAAVFERRRVEEGAWVAEPTIPAIATHGRAFFRPNKRVMLTVHLPRPAAGTAPHSIPASR